MRSRQPSRVVLVVSLMVASLVIGVLGSAQADQKSRKRKVDRKVSQLRNDLEDTSQRVVAALRSLHRAESKLPAAQARVARVRGRLAAAQARDAMLADKLQVAVAEVASAQQKIVETVATMDAAKVLIGRIARSSYQQGSYAELAVVLDSESADDFATRLVLVQNALRSEGSMLGDLANDRADLAAQRATLDAKRAQIAELKQEQEQLVATIQGLEKDALDAQQAVESLIADRETAVAAVQRERDAERARLAAAQAQSQALARSIAAAARRAAARARLGAGPSRGRGIGGGGLAWPANGRISTYAGFRINPVTGSPSCHSGIDIAPGYGAPIYAAAAGVVVATTYTSWDGNTTIIAHGGGMTTWYAHQDSFGVRVGEHVGRGEVIGHVGSSGFATGPHLHFDIAIGDVAYDPMGWYGGPRRSVASLCPNGPYPVL
jgi:murein DD-endopeptidase MepM/ murein hydrolase activator NlpD